MRKARKKKQCRWVRFIDFKAYKRVNREVLRMCVPLAVQYIYLDAVMEMGRREVRFLEDGKRMEVAWPLLCKFVSVVSRR